MFLSTFTTFAISADQSQPAEVTAHSIKRTDENEAQLMCFLSEVFAHRYFPLIPGTSMNQKKDIFQRENSYLLNKFILMGENEKTCLLKMSEVALLNLFYCKPSCFLNVYFIILPFLQL